jgi:hypothetical protein
MGTTLKFQLFLKILNWEPQILILKCPKSHLTSLKFIFKQLNNLPYSLLKATLQHYIKFLTLSNLCNIYFLKDCSSILL